MTCPRCGNPNHPGTLGIANPASEYCVEHGGSSEGVTEPGGGEFGVCVFPDGSRCEEWAFKRGECQQGQCFDPRGRCDTPGPAVKYGGPPSADTPAASTKGSPLGWIAAGLGAVGLFGWLLLRGEGNAKPNPASRLPEPGQRWIAKRSVDEDVAVGVGKRVWVGETLHIVNVTPDWVVGQSFERWPEERSFSPKRFLANFKRLKSDPNFSLTKLVDDTVAALGRASSSQRHGRATRAVLFNARAKLAAEGWDGDMIKQAIKDMRDLAELESFSGE